MPSAEPQARASVSAVSFVRGQRFEERYLRAPAPLHFPEEEEVPENKRHLELRTLLYQLLKFAFADHASIGCDQFVYWDPTDPRACLAPDGFVRLGEPDHLFDTWKVWDHGAPHVAIEIGSRSDLPEPRWEDKLDKYRRLGVSELVRFEPKSGELRIWDSIGHDLIEREVVGGSAQSHFLPGFWRVTAQDGLGAALRLAYDALGERLYLTPAEHEAEARRAEAEARRAEAETAAQRIRELEALLESRR
jgi:hypothetical protein